MNKKTEEVLLSLLKVGLLQRYIGIGAREDELFEAYNQIKSLADWCRVFSQVAERFEKVADAAEDRIVKASNYRTATIYSWGATVTTTRHRTSSFNKKLVYSIFAIRYGM